MIKLNQIYNFNFVVSNSFLRYAREDTNNIFPLSDACRNILDAFNINVLTNGDIILEANVNLTTKLGFFSPKNPKNWYLDVFRLFTPFNCDENNLEGYLDSEFTLTEDVYDKEYSLINVDYYFGEDDYEIKTKGVSLINAEEKDYEIKIKGVLHVIKSGFKNINEVINYGINYGLDKIYILSRSLIFKTLVSDDKLIENDILVYGDMFRNYDKLEFLDIQKYYNLDDLNIFNLKGLLNENMFINAKVKGLSKIGNGVKMLPIFSCILCFYDEEKINKNIDAISNCICNIIDITLKLKDILEYPKLDFRLILPKLALRKNICDCIKNNFYFYFKNKDIRYYILDDISFIMEKMLIKNIKPNEYFINLYLDVLKKLSDSKFKGYLPIEDYIILGTKVGIDIDKIIENLDLKAFDKKFSIYDESYRLIHKIEEDSLLRFTLRFKKEYNAKSEMFNDLVYNKLIHLDEKYLNEESEALGEIMSYIIKRIGSVITDNTCTFLYNPIDFSEEEINILSKYIDFGVRYNIKHDVSIKKLIEIATDEFKENSILWLIKKGCDHLRYLETDDKEKINLRNKLERKILNVQI